MGTIKTTRVKLRDVSSEQLLRDGHRCVRPQWETMRGGTVTIECKPYYPGDFGVHWCGPLCAADVPVFAGVNVFHEGTLGTLMRACFCAHELELD